MINMANANKQEMITKVSVLGNIPKTEATVWYDTVIAAFEEVVIDELKGAKLGKLGSLRLVDRKAREFRVPNSDDVVVKPDRKNLKLEVNKTTQKAIEEATAQ